MALTTTFLAACDFTPESVRHQIQEKRMRDLGIETVDPSGTSDRAGVSALRDLDVPALNPRRIGADTLSTGYLQYVHRCGTCHSAPDPATRTGSEWKYVMPRMREHIKEVGLIPLRATDQTMILAFLTRHAAEG